MRHRACGKGEHARRAASRCNRSSNAAPGADAAQSHGAAHAGSHPQPGSDPSANGATTAPADAAPSDAKPADKPAEPPAETKEDAPKDDDKKKEDAAAGAEEPPVQYHLIVAGDTLRKIAGMTGGKYYRADSSEMMAKIYAEIVGYGQVAGPDASLLHQPSNAITKALDKAGKQVADVSLFELNEAFAAVGLASMADLGITDEITNVNGGAISIGHPLGMSGARVTLTLALELARRGGGLGAAALCGGGGQGDAILIQVAG